MKSPRFFVTIVTSLFAIFAAAARAQNLPGSLSFTVSGSFENGVGQSHESILIADKNLSDGYAPGMDLKDAPVTLNPNGPAGTAAFQWGVASAKSA